MASDLTIKTNKEGFDLAEGKLDNILSKLGESYKNIDVAGDDMQEHWKGTSGTAFSCGNLSLQLTLTDRMEELLQLRTYIKNAQEAIENTDQDCGEKFDKNINK